MTILHQHLCFRPGNPSPITYTMEVGIHLLHGPLQKRHQITRKFLAYSCTVLQEHSISTCHTQHTIWNTWVNHINLSITRRIQWISSKNKQQPFRNDCSVESLACNSQCSKIHIELKATKEPKHGWAPPSLGYFCNLSWKNVGQVTQKQIHTFHELWISQSA